MKSRRSFILNAAKVSAGVLLIPTAIVSESSAQTINGNNLILSTEHKLDLRSGGSGNSHIVVKGKIYDKTGVALQSGATIEVLNASNSLFHKRRSTKVRSNANGEYELLLDMPEREDGKSPRMKFRISNGVNAYSSEVIVTSCDAHISDKHWEHNHQLGDKLFPVKESFANHSVVSFNLSV